QLWHNNWSLSVPDMQHGLPGDQEPFRKKGRRVMAPQHFLVPIDFSEYANQALDYAITLAGKLGARVTLLHVLQPLPLGGVDMGMTLPATFVQDLEAEIRRDMEALRERVTAAGLEGDMVIVHGVPFHEIIEAAKTQQVDLIVLGT